jgi:hypothetical protein
VTWLTLPAFIARFVSLAILRGRLFVPISFWTRFLSLSRKPRTFIFAATASLLLVSTAFAGDIQELFPENDVSRQPFVEFRARDGQGGTHTGHAFIALGFEGDNGSLTYVAFAGFYPEDDSKLDVVAQVLPGVQGHLDYAYEDMHSDVFFRIKIDPEKAYEVRDIIASWNKGKTYVLPFQNCVTMSTEVARALNLKVPDTMDKVQDIGVLWPVNFVQFLAANNKSDSTASYTASTNKELDKQWAGMAQVIRHEQDIKADYQRRLNLINGLGAAPGIMAPSPSEPSMLLEMTPSVPPTQR